MKDLQKTDTEELKNYQKAKRTKKYEWKNKLLYVMSFLVLTGVSFKDEQDFGKRRVLEQRIQKQERIDNSKSKLENISVFPNSVKKPAYSYEISQKGINLIEEFEGYREKSYLCPGKVWTIGYGHTRDVKKGDEITKEKAIEYLKNDLRTTENAIKDYVKVPLTQNQYNALVSFTYNVGAEAFRKSTLLKKLNSGNYQRASKEFERWNKAKGKILNGLVKRREKERKLFLEK